MIYGANDSLFETKQEKVMLYLTDNDKFLLTVTKFV